MVKAMKQEKQNVYLPLVLGEIFFQPDSNQKQNQKLLEQCGEALGTFIYICTPSHQACGHDLAALLTP